MNFHKQVRKLNNIVLKKSQMDSDDYISLDVECKEDIKEIIRNCLGRRNDLQIYNTQKWYHSLKLCDWTEEDIKRIDPDFYNRALEYWDDRCRMPFIYRTMMSKVSDQFYGGIGESIQTYSLIHRRDKTCFDIYRYYEAIANLELIDLPPGLEIRLNVLDQEVCKAIFDGKNYKFPYPTVDDPFFIRHLQYCSVEVEIDKIVDIKECRLKSIALDISGRNGKESQNHFWDKIGIMGWSGRSPLMLFGSGLCRVIPVTYQKQFDNPQSKKTRFKNIDCRVNKVPVPFQEELLSKPSHGPFPGGVYYHKVKDDWENLIY